MNRKIKRLMAGGIILVITFGFVNMYAYGKVSGDKHSEQLDLGYKYLSEMDYEQAEVTFEHIISIDDKNYEAYLGLAEVYTAMDEPEMAEEIMEDAVDKCGYGEIQVKVIEAEAGLRQFRSMVSYNRGFESVSGLTDFCVQGLDLFLGWIEKASTVIDGVSAAWRDITQVFNRD
ncbi:MAG: tetratricopeptide repeat protein [Lachnospiraceae bacterium]|jgi:tetratricopeptide (TPR) repeat protein|nr:tetratricopeptide repeat protein [Lachnospiraceae bacterium]